MTYSMPSMSQIIWEAYANLGISITDLAKMRIRKHIFCNARVVDEFVASSDKQVTLPPISAHLFKDISIEELNVVEKDLSAELGIMVLISLRQYSSLPFFVITLNKIPSRRRLNNDNC